jgi:hypothetical protein
VVAAEHGHPIPSDPASDVNPGTPDLGVSPSHTAPA